MQTTGSRDRKRANAVKYGQQLAEHKGGNFSTDDWREFRHKLQVESGIELPATASIYRWYGTWAAFKQICNARKPRRQRANKCTEAELIANLQTAARIIGKPVLSTHSYDHIRDANPDEQLRSSSAIRKHLGPWPVACARAGLQSPDQRGPRRFSAQECIAALRRAKAGAEGRLTLQAYADFVVELASGDEHEELPGLGQVIDTFGSWEAALHFADVEQSDVVHPDALWNAQEAREIAQYAEIMLRRRYDREFDEAGYEFLCSLTERPMPTYHVLLWLLAQ